MFRLAAVSLIALLLAGCGQNKGASIEGVWAWFDPESCVGDRDTVEFAGDEFFHRRQGAVYVHGIDVNYRVTDDAGVEWVTATYTVETDDPNLSRTVSLTFEPEGESTLLFRGSVVDGVAPPNAGNVIGRELYRCVDGHAVMDDASDELTIEGTAEGE